MVSSAVLMGALICLFSTVVVILGLMPAYMRAHTERSTKAAALEALQSAKDSDHSDRELLLTARKRTVALGAIGKKSELSNALSLILDNRPKGIALRTFVYTHKDAVATLSVSGISSDASAFRQYIEWLKAKKLFDKVTVPLTSLASIEAGSFTVSITGSF